jgi:hypothetical protein
MNNQITLVVALGGLATILLVVAQHSSQPKYRPSMIIKQLAREVADSYRRGSESRRVRAKYLAERARRPCHACDHEGDFRTISKAEGRSSGMILVQIAVIIFIIAPLTLGIGLLLLPCMLIGGKTTSLQECPNCGAHRPE